MTTKFFLSLTDQDGLLIDRFEVMLAEDCPEELDINEVDIEFVDAINAPDLASRIRWAIKTERLKHSK